MLRVTKLTDYASLVLSLLAQAPQRVHSTAELAERAHLETPTVSKLLKALAQAGLVAAFRGASGGYRLAQPATQIRLITIVEAIEGPLGMTECSLHDGDCSIEQHCGVRANWRRINDVVIDALASVTLAQMLESPATTAAPPRRRKSIPVHVTSA